MKNSVTCIIPIWRLSGARLRNFNAILPAVLKLGIDVIVAESKEPTFNKSALINTAVSVAKTEYIWMLDADVYFDYSRMLSLIRGQACIQPFNRIIIMSDSETEAFISSKRISFHRGTRRHWCVPLGPHTFVVKRTVFEDVGGMCEAYSGYGWEDLEFAWRLLKTHKSCCLHLPAIHLHHAKSATNPENTRLWKATGINIAELVRLSNRPYGAGDYIAKAFEASGIAGIWHRLSPDCRCLQRRSWINARLTPHTLLNWLSRRIKKPF